MILANQKCNLLENSKIPNFERMNSVGARTLGPDLFERSDPQRIPNRTARAAEIFFEISPLLVGLCVRRRISRIRWKYVYRESLSCCL